MEAEPEVQPKEEAVLLAEKAMEAEAPEAEAIAENVVEAAKDDTPEPPVGKISKGSDGGTEQGHDEEPGEDDMIMHEINEMEPSDEHEEDEEEQAEEPEQEEIVEKYDTYTRENLIVVLDEIVKEENVLKIKTRIALIKVAFLKLSRDFRQQKLEEFLKAGGVRENYTPEPDP